MTVRPFVVGGEERTGGLTREVRSPWDGRIVATVARPSATDLEDAIASAAGAFDELRRLPAWKRAAPLRAAADRLEAEKDLLAERIRDEAGKPIVQARAEVDRAVGTLRASAEEAGRVGGEVLPMDGAPGGEGRLAITRRFPVGPVACITPFNFPLNLVCHKVGPALAAGCPFVLKPASQTPGPALDLAAILLEEGALPGAVSVLPLGGEEAGPLVEDPRIRAVSFTGSPAVGWDLRRRASRARVVLELGGNAGLIVDRTAEVAVAAARAAAGAFGYAGQSCISVQRVFAHREVFDAFLRHLLDATTKQVVGDPADERTTVGPMISEPEARRIEGWIEEARAAGARVLAGGRRNGSVVEPTVLTGAAPDLRICSQEAFAPVVVLEPFDRIEDAIRAVDASTYGLQAGIFTRDLGAALAAFEGIEAGAVLVNEVPTWRADAMPYGGVKESGTGREGPRWAIEDFTELRLLVLRS